MDGLETDNCADTDNDHKCDECGATLSSIPTLIITIFVISAARLSATTPAVKRPVLKKPVCDTCGNEYGDIDSDNHKRSQAC